MIEKVEVATKAILMSQDKKVLIIRRSSLDSFAWGEFDLPWGRSNLWESPIEWVSRELQEETSIIFKDFSPLKTWGFNQEATQIVGITYIGHIESISSEIPVALSPEHSEFKWIWILDYNDMDLPKWLKSELTLAFNHR